MVDMGLNGRLSQQISQNVSENQKEKSKYFEDDKKDQSREDKRVLKGPKKRRRTWAPGKYHQEQFKNFSPVHKRLRRKRHPREDSIVNGEARKRKRSRWTHKVNKKRPTPVNLPRNIYKEDIEALEASESHHALFQNFD